MANILIICMLISNKLRRDPKIKCYHVLFIVFEDDGMTHILSILSSADFV